MNTVRIGQVDVSRFVVGSNPFSGFSHQSVDTDSKMKHYWTVTRIKALLREAESLGVNTLIARCDHHVMRVLLEYWDEGGRIQWIGQSCPELGPTGVSVRNAVSGGAKGCHIHGGVTDKLLSEGRLGEVQKDIDDLREAGLAAGIAGHNPAVFQWADQHLDVDYYMCCYYNPTDRSRRAEHVHGAVEKFVDDDRQTMRAVIRTLSKPVIHYKVLAAGRNDPAEAFRVAAKTMRDSDAVCVGIYTEEVPDMLKIDVALLEDGLAAVGKSMT